MAITWELRITPISIQDKTVSILATRTDSLEPDDPRIYYVSKAPIETTPQRLAAIDEIWAKHQAALTLETQIQTFLNGLETQGKANLEARE